MLVLLETGFNCCVLVVFVIGVFVVVVFVSSVALADANPVVSFIFKLVKVAV